MATIQKKQWRIAKTMSGIGPVRQEFTEAATQTFPANGLVTLSATQTITGVTGDDDTVFWGIAEAAGKNSAGATEKSGVFRLTPDLIFVGNMVESAVADHVSVAADHGPMGIIYDDANKLWFLDASEQGGADDRVFVLGVAPGSTVGDTNAEFYFHFLEAAIQGL